MLKLTFRYGPKRLRDNNFKLQLLDLHANIPWGGGFRLYSIFPLSVQRRPCGSPTGSSELSSICVRHSKKPAKNATLKFGQIWPFFQYSNLVFFQHFSNTFPTSFGYGFLRGYSQPKYSQIPPNTPKYCLLASKESKLRKSTASGVAKLVRGQLVANLSNLQECKVSLNLAGTELQVLNRHNRQKMR